MAKITKKIKAFVAARAKYYCEYCKAQKMFSGDDFSVDHIDPQSKGGNDNLSNLAFCCQACNNRKYTSINAIDPITGINAPLFNPRTQLWNTHFQWSGDYTLILGITDTGRATVNRLQLNRSGLVNLRRALFNQNLHPPD
ncbi:MAG: HNH endonuclease [Saprospiraceae bacterium]